MYANICRKCLQIFFCRISNNAKNRPYVNGERSLELVVILPFQMSVCELRRYVVHMSIWACVCVYVQINVHARRNNMGRAKWNQRKIKNFFLIWILNCVRTLSPLARSFASYVSSCRFLHTFLPRHTRMRWMLCCVVLCLCMFAYTFNDRIVPSKIHWKWFVACHISEKKRSWR